MLTRALPFLVGALLALPQPAPAAPSYTATPVSGKYTSAVAMNNASQVAINNFGPEVPYRIGSINGPTSSESVGTLGGYESVIRGLNNKGEAVGSSTTGDGANHAFLYSAGRIHDLTVAYGLDTASAISDKGAIVGQTGNRAVVVNAGGAVDVFGPPNSGAGAVNNAGVVVGDYILEGRGDRAFQYAEGKFSDLGTLGGTSSVPTAVNDAGAIVGYSSTAVEQSHAFLFEEGSMRDLGPSTQNSTASDINSLGQIVGTMDGRAFIYANGTLTDLNTLISPEAGLLLVSAEAINDRQQILANACDSTGTFCYSEVRLDPIPPVPEPGSTGMLLSGVALLGMHRFGRRRLQVPACLQKNEAAAVRVHRPDDLSPSPGRGILAACCPDTTASAPAR